MLIKDHRSVGIDSATLQGLQAATKCTISEPRQTGFKVAMLLSTESNMSRITSAETVGDPCLPNLNVFGLQAAKFTTLHAVCCWWCH
jgi:hypothetical protein